MTDIEKDNAIATADLTDDSTGETTNQEALHANSATAPLESAESASSETDVLAKIEWNSVAASLDFLGDAESERVSKFQELAERVAATVSANNGENTIENLVTPEAGANLSAEAEALNELPVMSEAEMEQMGFQALEDELSAAENDAAAEPTEFIESDQLLSIIESLLFSTDKPVSVATIKMIFKNSNIRTRDITRALDILASELASSSRGVTLEEINGGYQLRTKVDNAEFLKRLAKVRPFRLSGPALEVMAIVAYKQPVTKHEIDEIRGVESGHLLRALMERGMVNFQGKAEHLPGKPMSYGTTRKFLETFGLRNTRELPTLSEIDDLLPEGIGAEVEEKETLSDLTGRLSNDIVASYSEGEDELLKIGETLSAIDTTSEFFEQEKVRERERRDRDRAQDIRERLMVGEEVEEKDRRWLDRFEAKLQAMEVAAATGEPMAVISLEEEAPTVSGELAALTAETSSGAGAADGESDDSDLDDLDLGQDLDANLEWDDSLESEHSDGEKES